MDRAISETGSSADVQEDPLADKSEPLANKSDEDPSINSDSSSSTDVLEDSSLTDNDVAENGLRDDLTASGAKLDEQIPVASPSGKFSAGSQSDYVYNCQNQFFCQCWCP